MDLSEQFTQLAADGGTVGWCAAFDVFGDKDGSTFERRHWFGMSAPLCWTAAPFEEPENFCVAFGTGQRAAAQEKACNPDWTVASFDPQDASVESGSGSDPDAVMVLKMGGHEFGAWPSVDLPYDRPDSGHFTPTDPPLHEVQQDASRYPDHVLSSEHQTVAPVESRRCDQRKPVRHGGPIEAGLHPVHAVAASGRSPADPTNPRPNGPRGLFRPSTLCRVQSYRLAETARRTSGGSRDGRRHSASR